MTASNLVVPLVVWGKKPPTHCISSVWMSPGQDCIATGCNDGQICLWDVDSDFKVSTKSSASFIAQFRKLLLVLV